MRVEGIVIVIVLAVLGGYFLVWMLPEDSVAHVSKLTELQRQQLLLETRKTNAQILGGGALLLGLLFTWRNVRIAEEGHVTERFTRAVDQLGSEKLEQRVGAIYALERLSSDSRKDHPAVMEIICSFLRHRERKPEESEPYKLPVGEVKRDDHDILVKIEKISGWAPPAPEDVRAAVSVLRRNRRRLRKSHSLDLSGADLRRVNLEKAQLRKVNLANLYGQRANFEGADLRGAYLYNAHMKMANLDGADLRGAIIGEAEFRHASLRKADLRGATVREATEYEFGFESDPDIDEVMEKFETIDLEYADLRDALVEGLDLERANLRNANLSSARGLTSWQISKAYGNNKTQLPIGVVRPFEWETDDEVKMSASNTQADD